MSELRVQFIHGLESSPQSVKALLFAEVFTACTPAMDTSDFEACVALQSDVAAQFAPDVLVGSSFGGGVAVAMLQRGLWHGPLLLLAQAAVRMGLPLELPGTGPVWLVHGRQDTIVDIEDSRRLAAVGAAERVRLIEVDDDHLLRSLVDSGDLVAWVRALGARPGIPAPD